MVKVQDFGFEEESIELAKSSEQEGMSVYGETNFPKPHHRYRLVLEAPNLSVEETYYWVLQFIRQDRGYADVEKITDMFSASEHSAFFGSAWQRVGINQDKASQFLATIGKMVKELFQLVRELRIIDERISYYEDSYSGSVSAKSAEITLKGIWIDLVEQGSKNPASVYGMARELSFTVLPDLFFSTHPQTSKQVDVYVDKLDFNRKVREVLKRKLRAFLEWKEATHSELKTKRKFTLKYLKQHYEIIKMYMLWVKPYLRNIRKLMLQNTNERSPDLVTAFENSLIEIEIMAKKLPSALPLDSEPHTNKEIYTVVIGHFFYNTTPSMNFQQEGYQKGPIHVGKVEMTLRGYAWSKDQIEKYRAYKAKEDMELLEVVDGSVKAAMEALGEELEKYLAEAGEESYQPKKAQGKAPATLPSALDPFTGVFKGLGELFGAIGGKSEKKSKTSFEIGKERAVAGNVAKRDIWQTYKEYKKAHGMMHWG